SFGIQGGRAAGARFIDALQLILRLVNIGDAKSLACHPASTTHRQLSPDELARAGVGEDMIRLSIGIEHIDDILDDLRPALDASRCLRPSPAPTHKTTRKSHAARLPNRYREAAMQVGIPRETLPGETRVAATPETVKKLVQAGHQVRVERGAGTAARYPDADYEKAGAELADAGATLGSELVLKVRRPDAAELGRMKPGAVLLGMLD